MIYLEITTTENNLAVIGDRANAICAFPDVLNAYAWGVWCKTWLLTSLFVQENIFAVLWYIKTNKV